MPDLPPSSKPVQRFEVGAGRDKSTSEKQEERLAQRLDRVTPTRQVPGSGRGNQKGDVRAEGVFLIEAKTVEPGKGSIAVKRQHILKIVREAAAARLAPLLVISFPDMPVGIDNDYAVVPMRVFNDMLEAFLDEE